MPSPLTAGTTRVATHNTQGKLSQITIQYNAFQYVRNGMRTYSHTLWGHVTVTVTETE